MIHGTCFLFSGLSASCNSDSTTRSELHQVMEIACMFVAQKPPRQYLKGSLKPDGLLGDLVLKLCVLTAQKYYVRSPKIEAIPVALPCPVVCATGFSQSGPQPVCVCHSVCRSFEALKLPSPAMLLGEGKAVVNNTWRTHLGPRCLLLRQHT